jgi:hypothetical protein
MLLRTSAEQEARGTGANNMAPVWGANTTSAYLIQAQVKQCNMMCRRTVVILGFAVTHFVMISPITTYWSNWTLSSPWMSTLQASWGKKA